jgi:hypothetical protein
MNYKQVRLRHGADETVTWLPVYAAKVGNRVTLPEFTLDIWWKVTVVYDFALSEAALRAKQRNDRGSLSSLVDA